MRSRISSVQFTLVFLLFAAFAGCHTPDSFHFGAYSEAEKFYEKGEYAKAIAKYEQYVRENPEGNMAVIARYFMAKSYEGLGQKDQAKELYRRISKENPDLIWAHFSKERLKAL